MVAAVSCQNVPPPGGRPSTRQPGARSALTSVGWRAPAVRHCPCIPGPAMRWTAALLTTVALGVPRAHAQTTPTAPTNPTTTSNALAAADFVIRIAPTTGGYLTTTEAM